MIKASRFIGAFLVALIFQGCGNTAENHPINGQDHLIRYDNTNKLLTDDITVVYSFDLWGTTGNNYQGASGLFQNVITPDSGKAREVRMEKVDLHWEARVLIPQDVTLLSYYFTDGDTCDYNDKKTYTSYIYDEQGKPVRNARFRNIDFLIMAGEPPTRILSEIKAEITDHPTNWIAQTVYWRKSFESAETFDKIFSIYEDGEKVYQTLVKKYGETDSLKHVRANLLTDYMTSLYKPFQELQEKANEEFMGIMSSIPIEKQYGSVKKRYLRYLEYEKRKTGNTNFLTNIVGAVAPDFEYKTIKGKVGKLSELRGNYVLLDFWGTWCGPCVGEIPNLKKAYASYHKEGFEILSISNDNFDEQKLESYVTEKEMSWNHVLEGQSGLIQKTYKIMSYPSLFLIDPDGKVVNISQDLRGELLGEKLKEIYNK